jgi:hypothetical protein
MPIDSISMCSNSLFMSNVDAGGTLRRLLASTTILCHHFDSTSDPEPQIMNQVRWLYLFEEATAICP